MCVCVDVGLTYGLEVQGHQLTACIPEELRVIVGGVYSGAFRIDTTQLQLVIPEHAPLRTGHLGPHYQPYIHFSQNVGVRGDSRIWVRKNTYACFH